MRQIINESVEFRVLKILSIFWIPKKQCFHFQNSKDSYLFVRLVKPMQVFSMSTLEESVSAVENLIKKTKPGTSTTMKSALAALYTADAETPFRFSNCIGLLQLDSDRQLKTYMLRFYDI